MRRQTGSPAGQGHPDQPDFASVYGDDDALTPRLAAHLWGAAVILADTHFDGSQPDVLEQDLPPVARRLADDAWMRRFALCFGIIADRLARGGYASEQLASCTAEEMALHVIIDHAEGFVADGVLPAQEHLPRREADTDLEWAREALFRDHDVLLLFNLSLDGIEDDTSEIQEHLRLAHLHPRDWFVTFDDQLEP